MLLWFCLRRLRLSSLSLNYTTMLLKFVMLMCYFALVFIGVRVFEFFLSTFAGLAGLQAFCDVVQFACFSLHESKFGRGPDGIHEQEKSLQSEFDELADDVLRTTSDLDVGESSEEENMFSSYSAFKERVEDTKACVWIVNVLFQPKQESLLISKDWKRLKSEVRSYGIQTAVYNCVVDPALCRRHYLASPVLMLIVPKGSHPNGSVKLHIYSKDRFSRPSSARVQHVFSWIEEKLSLKVRRVKSFTEVTSLISEFSPTISVIYETKRDMMPLVLLSLSVKFTGRISFFHLQRQMDVQGDRLIALNAINAYKYGDRDGESFNYSCMDLFLRSLHPELNDIFIVSIVLLNMACWLELFVCRGGPLKRICCSLWAFAVTNLILVFFWLPVIQIMYVPEVQPIIKICLQSLQQVMLSNIGALVRQDLLQLSEHIPIIFMGFVVYGLFLGFMKYRLTQGASSQPFSMSRLIQDDIQEFREVLSAFARSLTPGLQIYIFEESIERILRRIAVPDLWLHQVDFAECVSSLPSWKYCSRLNDALCLEEDSSGISSSASDSDEICNETVPCSFLTSIAQDHIVWGRKCSVCLDAYSCGENVKCLPCGHFFHKTCIDLWLLSGNDSKNRKCPTCRWPVTIPKGIGYIDVAE